MGIISAVLSCDCGGPTKVIQQRGRIGQQSVWRRRKCSTCGTMFPTYESRTKPVTAAELTRLLDRLSNTLALSMDATKEFRQIQRALKDL